MVQIPDSLRCLFTAKVEQREHSVVIEVLEEEVDAGEITPGETYRVVLFPEQSQQDEPQQQDNTETGSPQSPPVSEGETRTVAIETTGDQGDGIAKIERGYVVIVPGSVPGDELTVEINFVKENFAMAEIVDGNDLTYE
jgi:predicted RNA-binding protein with TRAM domain